MAEEKPPQMRRVIGVPQKREEITAALTECYARDLFGLEEYERRIELVHSATTLDELEALVSDVPPDVLRAAKAAAPPSARASGGAELTVSRCVRKITDRRLAVGRLALTGRGSVIKLDYRALADLPAEMTVHVEVTGSVLKIIVPPEVEVTEEMEYSGSVIKYRRGWLHRRARVRTRMRVTGKALRSVVKIVTRRSWLS